MRRRRPTGLAVLAAAVVVATVAPGQPASADFAVDDAYATGVDEVLEVDAPGVLGNDAVDPADVTGLTVVDGPSDGNLVIGSDGAFNYTPEPGFAGTDTFTYAVSTGGATGPVELHPDLAPPTVAARFGDEVLFFGDDGVIGSELWATDGTVDGTRLVADINPGGVASDSIATGRNEDLVAWRDHLYFPADGPDGIELWRTDGTTAGTEQVVDLVGGPGDSRPSHLAVVDDTLLFWASESGARGGTEDRTLWALTAADATPLPQHEAQPGTRIGHPSVVLDTGLVYAWDNDLYRWSNGGPTLITPPSADDNVGIVRTVTVGDQAILELSDGQFAEGGLWVTDGLFVQEIVDDPTSLAGASDTHAFLQTAGAAPRSLDLAGTLTSFPAPADFATLPDPDTTSPGNTARLGDRALLLGGGPTTGGAPWISDGTAAGTEPLLADTGATTTRFLGAASADGSLWFSFDGVLYRSDATPAGTTPVLDHGSPGMVPVDGGTFLFHHLRGPDAGDQDTAWAIPHDTGSTDTATVTITVADDAAVDVDEPVGVSDQVDVTVGAAPLEVSVVEQVGVDDSLAVELGPVPPGSVTDEPVGVTDEVVVALGPAPVVVDVDEPIGVDDSTNGQLTDRRGCCERSEQLQRARRARDANATFALGTVDPAVVAPGDTIVFTGDGFAADSPVDVTLFSDPVDLGAAAASDAGAVRVVATIPIDTASGPHELVAVGRGPHGATHTVRGELTVQPPDLPLPGTGAPLTDLGAAALALLLAGVLALRTQRQPPSPAARPSSGRHRHRRSRGRHEGSHRTKEQP